MFYKGRRGAWLGKYFARASVAFTVERKGFLILPMLRFPGHTGEAGVSILFLEAGQWARTPDFYYHVVTKGMLDYVGLCWFIFGYDGYILVSVHPETITVRKVSQKSYYWLGIFGAICYGPYSRN